MAYTAFGDRLNLGAGAPPGSFPRYEYAGGFGYESGLISLTGANSNLPTIMLQHLGARWYDPAIGRFVQRDPIGIAGGLGIYLYCRGNPVILMDSTGLTSLLDGVPYIDRFLDWLLNGGGSPYAGGGIATATAGNYKWKWGCGRLCNRVGIGFGAAAMGWKLGKTLDKRFGISDRIGQYLADTGIVGPGGPGILDDVGKCLGDALDRFGKFRESGQMPKPWF